MIRTITATAVSLKEHAVCHYSVKTFTISVRVPCNAPKKSSYGTYICN